MEQGEFIDAVTHAIQANPKAGNKWDQLEELFAENDLRGNGTLNYGGGADRTTRARQLGTSKKHKGHDSRAVAVHSAYVVGQNTLETYDNDKDAYLDHIRDSLLREHSTFETCLVIESRPESTPKPIRLFKRSTAPSEVPYEEWWPDLACTVVPRADGESAGTPSGGADPEFSEEDLVRDAFIPDDELKNIVQLLRGRKNVILQGPPGVGKSFIAKRIAYAALGTKSPSRVLSLQFHPNYSYEEFIEGYRPTDGGFELRPGSLREFIDSKCADGDLCVLVLDELNRANLSSVLGECMFLLEADKRGDQNAVQLLYGRDSFSLPENLLVLGLMNTADRSIALVDYALRRRFAFVDLPPRFNGSFKAYLRDQLVPDRIIDRLFEAMAEVNGAIRSAHVALGRGFEIGHSYFCKCPDLASLADEPERERAAESWIEEVIRFDIAPLLREYWFDDRDARSGLVRTLLGRDLSEADSELLVD